MIIAIASTENHLKSSIDQHFGRCDWYCMYDTLSKKISFIENPMAHKAESAGLNAANFLIDLGIEMVIAGRFGIKVVEVFKNKKIQMVIPETPKTIKDIIHKLK